MIFIQLSKLLLSHLHYQCVYQEEITLMVLYRSWKRTGLYCVAKALVIKRQRSSVGS